MIIRSLCNTCLSAFEILVEASHVELMKQISDESGHSCPCPRLCGGRIFLFQDPTAEALAKDPRLRVPTKVTGKELYQAVNGLGLPDEVQIDSTVLESLLKSSGIQDVVLETSQSKVYLHELHLKNGVTIHLSSGHHGAQVLKITKEREHGTGTDR